MSLSIYLRLLFLLDLLIVWISFEVIRVYSFIVKMFLLFCFFKQGIFNILVYLIILLSERALIVTFIFNSIRILLSAPVA